MSEKMFLPCPFFARRFWLGPIFERGTSLSHVHMGNELLEKKTGRVALVEHFGIGNERAASTHFGRRLMMNKSDTRWAWCRSLVTGSADLGMIERWISGFMARASQVCQWHNNQEFSSFKSW